MIHRKKKAKFFDWGKPRRKLENWGKNKVFNRKTKNLFSGVGIAAVTAVFAMGIFAGIIILARFVKQAIEVKMSQNLVVQIQRKTQELQQQQPSQPQSQQQQPTTTVQSVQPSPPSVSTATVPSAPLPAAMPSNLIYTSFTDLFSGNGWLNTGQTTMYRDNDETAFMFPPKFEWKPTGSQGTFGTPEKPAGITTKVVQVGKTYRVLVYAPDGSPILTEANTPITSDYSGSVGIGGTADDFVVVYGAYWGAGARITNVDGSWQVQNISQFFGIRSMGGGFQPQVIYADKNFYIYDGGDGLPKLIKLFTNGTGQIQGAVDLSQSIFTSDVRSADFAPAPTGSGGTLVAKLTSPTGIISYYLFTDEGFDKSKPLQIVSANISNYPGVIYSANVSELTLSQGGGTASFYFSDDGAHWVAATPGTSVALGAKRQPLYWKAVFTPSGDQWSSPWFDIIGVSYTVEPSN